MYQKFFKRFIDIVVSGICIVLLLPVWVMTALLVKIKLGSPVIFKQERPGYRCKMFKIYKFKTMLDPQTRDGRKLTDEERLAGIEQGIDMLSDEERLTKFGRMLRATSLDELPELFNIFKGDMSFVGPRPLAVIYLPYYTEQENRRHDVRPGLTGLAQVNGRNTVAWDDKFRYDVEYVDNISFWLDCKIIFKTIAVVLKREDIGQGEARPEAFNLVRQRELDEQKAEVK